MCTRGVRRIPALEIRTCLATHYDIPGYGFAFSSRHQLSTNTLAAKRFWDEEKLNEEPSVGCAAPQATCDSAISVFKHKYERPVVICSGLPSIVGDQRSNDRIADRFVGRIGQANR